MLPAAAMLDLTIGAVAILTHSSTAEHQPSVTAVVILTPIFLPPLSDPGIVTVLCQDDLSRGSLELSTQIGSSSPHGSRHMQSSLSHLGKVDTQVHNKISAMSVTAHAAVAATVCIAVAMPFAAAVASIHTTCRECSAQSLHDKALCPAALDAAFHLGAAALAAADGYTAPLMVPATIEAFCLSTETSRSHCSSSQSYAVAAPLLTSSLVHHKAEVSNSHPCMVKVTNHALLSSACTWGTAGLLAKPFAIRESPLQPSADSVQNAAANMLYEVEWQASGTVKKGYAYDVSSANVAARLRSCENASHVLATGIQLAAHASTSGLASFLLTSFSQQSGIGHVDVRHAEVTTNQYLLAGLLKTLNQEAGSTTCSVMSLDSNASSTAGSTTTLGMSTAAQSGQPSDEQGNNFREAVSYLPLLAGRSMLAQTGSASLLAAAPQQARGTIVITGEISTLY